MSSQDQNTVNQTVTPLRDEALATKSVLETARVEGKFQNLLELARQAGLEPILQGAERITLFAPEDGTWTAQADGDPGTICARLLVMGAFTADELVRSGRVRNRAGEMLEVRREGSEVRIGGMRVRRADIPCTNGVIQVMEGSFEGKV